MDELRGVTLVGRWEPGGGGVTPGAIRWIPGRWFNIKPSGANWFNIKPFGRPGCDKGLTLNQQNLQAPRVYWTLGINHLRITFPAFCAVWRLCSVWSSLLLPYTLNIVVLGLNVNLKREKSF
jgi:hypothetical protein